MAATFKKSGYNIVRDDKLLLDAHKDSPASFVINLFPSHWTLNNGPKFMYNNQVSSILDDIRAFKIPVDFVDVFDRVGVQYFEGCLIVELVDYRPPKPKEPLLETPDVQRVVCRPNSETIWKDICRLNENHGYKMTDMDALEIEAKILLQTSHPLCLNPDPHLTRIVNNVLRVSTPNIPNSLKRKAASPADLEEDEAEKAKRAKIMQFMNPRAGRAINPTYRTLAFAGRKPSQVQETGQTASAPRPSQAAMQTSQAPTPTPAQTVQETSSPSKDSISATPAQPNAQLPQQHVVQQSAPAVVQQQSAQKQPQQPQQPASTHNTVEVARKPTPVAHTSASSPRPMQPPSRPVSTVPQQNPAAPPQPVIQQPVQFPPPPPNFLKNPPPVGKRRPTGGNAPAPAPVPQNPPPIPAQLNQHPSLQPAQSSAAAQASNVPQTQIQPQPAVVQPPMPHVPLVPQAANQQHVQMTMAPFLQNRTGMSVVMQPYTTQAIQQLRQHSQSNSGRSSPANTNASPVRPASAAMSHHSPHVPNALPAGVPGRSSPAVGEQVRQSPMVPGRTLSAQNVAPQGTPQPQHQQIQQPPQQQPPQQHPQPQPTMQPGQLTPQQQQLQMQNYLRQQHQQRLLMQQQQQLMQSQQNRPPTVPPGGQMQMTPQQMAQPHLVPREQAAAVPHAFASMQMPPQMFPYQTQWGYVAWAQAQQAQQARAMAGRGVGQPVQMTQQMMQQYQQQFARNVQGQNR